jgi:hypothetical protein
VVKKCEPRKKQKKVTIGVQNVVIYSKTRKIAEKEGSRK